MAIVKKMSDQVSDWLEEHTPYRPPGKGGRMDQHLGRCLSVMLWLEEQSRRLKRPWRQVLEGCTPHSSFYRNFAAPVGGKKRAFEMRKGKHGMERVPKPDHHAQALLLGRAPDDKGSRIYWYIVPPPESEVS